ncbi:MAG: alanine--glyoxylate aminotransferase family protein [Andreesenia angusta]|nr:alanine--glyoxylate aminotransferase family protein [Andreesenia angusta]
MDKLIMTAGPTQIREDVRMAMSREIVSPDFEPSFFEYYKETADKIGELMKTNNDILIMAGEGILGLEAACASLIEEGDRVLCIENGIFGRDFGDFAKLYGADVEYFKSSYRRGVDISALKEFLLKDSDFKLATVVGCETPSGVANQLDKIGPILNSYGILVISDIVSSIGGDEVKVDEWKIDIGIGASQKCISAAPGLTILSVSDRAWNAIKNRKTAVKSYYCNIGLWENWYEKKWFPYTQSISDIYGLRKAVDNIIEEGDYIKRHEDIALRIRRAITESGLSLYTKSDYSNCVTVIEIPEGLSYSEIYEKMLENGVMISGAFDILENKVFRIGNMGENAREDKVYRALEALDRTMRELGVELKREIHKAFNNK